MASSTGSFRMLRVSNTLRGFADASRTAASTNRPPARWATFQAGVVQPTAHMGEPDLPRERSFHPFSNIATASLLRSYCLGKMLSSRMFSRPGLAVLKEIAKFKGLLLNPDRNLLLRRVLKAFVYDQFCAGTNKHEVQQTIAGIKQQGYSGVILCHAKEIQHVQHDSKRSNDIVELESAEDVERWRMRNLETLAFMDSSDVLGIKVTGAGPRVAESLKHWTPFPEEFRQAIREICELAQAKGCRVWIDAEQQAFQDGIDHLAMDLMRVFNVGTRPVVYNTLQAYLKNSRLRLQRQLQLSIDEGWTLAIKLVRGAYLDSDDRSRIHNSKAETDESYNGIARSVLHRAFPGYPLCAPRRPALELALAGHNRKSARDARDLAQKLDAVGSLWTKPEFAQLQGMADDIGSELLSMPEDTRSDWRPRVYKYLTWGSLQDCMLYLVRRAQENQGVTQALPNGSEVFAELKRRLLQRFGRSIGAMTSEK